MQARLRGIDEAAHYRRVSRGSMIVLHAEGFCSEERGGELAQFRLQLAFALLGIGRRTDSRLYASPSPRSERSEEHTSELQSH